MAASIGCGGATAWHTKKAHLQTLHLAPHLNSFTHKRMGVDEIGLSKVGEAIEDENVAKVEGGVDLDQLVRRPL